VSIALRKKRTRDETADEVLPSEDE